MEIKSRTVMDKGIRLSAVMKEKEVGRAFLYILGNDLHQRPFGFLEDVFVDEDQRGQGIGKKLVSNVIKVAQENNCYKIIATSRHSRPQVHKMYERLGFKNHGFEFRLDL